MDPTQREEFLHKKIKSILPKLDLSPEDQDNLYTTIMPPKSFYEESNSAISEVNLGNFYSTFVNKFKDLAPKNAHSNFNENIFSEWMLTTKVELKLSNNTVINPTNFVNKVEQLGGSSSGLTTDTRQLTHNFLKMYNESTKSTIQSSKLYIDKQEKAQILKNGAVDVADKTLGKVKKAVNKLEYLMKNNDSNIGLNLTKQVEVKQEQNLVNNVLVTKNNTDNVTSISKNALNSQSNIETYENNLVTGAVNTVTKGSTFNENIPNNLTNAQDLGDLPIDFNQVIDMANNILQYALTFF